MRFWGKSLEKKLIDAYVDLRLEYESLRREIAEVKAKQAPFTITRESIAGLTDAEINEMQKTAEAFKDQLREILAVEQEITRNTSFNSRDI